VFDILSLTDRRGLPGEELRNAAFAIGRAARMVARDIVVTRAEYPDAYSGSLSRMVSDLCDYLIPEMSGFKRAPLGGPRKMWIVEGNDEQFKFSSNPSATKFGPTLNASEHLAGGVLLAYSLDLNGGEKKAGITGLWIAELGQVTRAPVQGKRRGPGTNHGKYQTIWLDPLVVPAEAAAASIRAVS
jgi:hypothetical protein